jgi:hypothetical protein
MRQGGSLDIRISCFRAGLVTGKSLISRFIRRLNRTPRTDGRLFGLTPTCRENNPRTEVLECASMAASEAFDGDGRDTFMTRCPVFVGFDH